MKNMLLPGARENKAAIQDAKLFLIRMTFRFQNVTEYKVKYIQTPPLQ